MPDPRHPKDDAPDAAKAPDARRRPSPDDASHRPKPVDIAEESAAGEEDPGAGLDVSIDRSKGSP